MSGSFFRVVLGVIVAAWALDAVAQDRAVFNDMAATEPHADYASESFSPSNDALAYVADPTESYVVEGSPDDESEPPRPARSAQQSSPSCRAYFPAGAAGDRSGTLCEQTDGSLRIVAAPTFTGASGAMAAPRSSQYCREYQQVVSAAGRPAVAYGRACRQADGSWQIVTPPVMAEAPARERNQAWSNVPAFESPETDRRAYAADSFAPSYQQRPQTRTAAPQRVSPPRAYSPSYWTYDNRLRLPDFYFGNLFWWLPRAQHDNGKHKGRDRYDD